jgi:TfoX/Sxy family transcriptional regulator of competence genes
MTHIPKTLQAILQAAAPPELELTFRPMFGGIMGYGEGKVFASLSDVGLALKLSGEDHAELLSLEGSKPLRYEPESPPADPMWLFPRRCWSALTSSGFGSIGAWLD